MASKVFYSFHYDGDHARAQLVRNMNLFTAQEELAPQRWEDVKRGGRSAIENWIAREMNGKDAVVVLVGASTSERPWVHYEIEKAWNDRIPLVGIRIHGLSDFGETSKAGVDPFAMQRLSDGSLMSGYVDLHDPSGRDSKAVYADIAANLSTRVAGARVRGVYEPTA